MLHSGRAQRVVAEHGDALREIDHLGRAQTRGDDNFVERIVGAAGRGGVGWGRDSRCLDDKKTGRKRPHVSIWTTHTPAPYAGINRIRFNGFVGSPTSQVL